MARCAGASPTLAQLPKVIRCRVALGRPVPGGRPAGRHVCRCGALLATGRVRPMVFYDGGDEVACAGAGLVESPRQGVRRKQPHQAVRIARGHLLGHPCSASTLDSRCPVTGDQSSHKSNASVAIGASLPPRLGLSGAALARQCGHSRGARSSPASAVQPRVWATSVPRRGRRRLVLLAREGCGGGAAPAGQLVSDAAQSGGVMGCPHQAAAAGASVARVLGAQGAPACGGRLAERLGRPRPDAARPWRLCATLGRNLVADGACSAATRLAWGGSVG